MTGHMSSKSSYSAGSIAENSCAEVLAPSGIIPVRTCRYGRCPHPDAIMPAGSHSLSLESRPTCDPKWYNLDYRPIAGLIEVKKTPKGRRGLHGLGARMEEHYWVECYETMLSICRQLKLRADPSAILLPEHPIFNVMYYIDCEERSVIHHPELGPLSEDMHYGIELFKARWLWNRRQTNPNYVLRISPGLPDFIGYLPGRDPKSLYVNTDGSRYRGRYKDGTVAEIPSDEVDNCSLSQVLTRLVQRRVAHEDAKRERLRLLNYNLYPYDDPLDDPRLSEPAAPHRVNPRVPVLRITQGLGPNTFKSRSQRPEIARRDSISLTAAENAQAESMHPPNDVPADKADAGDNATTSKDPSISSPSNLTPKGSDTPSTASNSTPIATSAMARYEPTSSQTETTGSPSNLALRGSYTLTTAPPSDPAPIVRRGRKRYKRTSPQGKTADPPSNLTPQVSDSPTTAPPLDPTPTTTTAKAQYQPTSPQGKTTDSTSNLTPQGSDTPTTPRPSGLATSDGKNEEGSEPKEDTSKPSPAL